MSPNYTLPVLESIRTLQDYGFNEVPINLNKILKALNRTITVCSYSKLAKRENTTIDDVIEMFETDLGVCSYNYTREKYIIYYNDTIRNVGLTRFTIAHELGHIFLNHHKSAKTNILLRSGISDETYEQYEKEANCFARNLLAPEPLARFVINDSITDGVSDVMEAFNMSFMGARTRINLLTLDGYRITEEHREYFQDYYVRYGDYCQTCGNAEIVAGSICKICGEKDTVFTKGVDRLIYKDGVPLDQNKKVMFCPTCENEEIGDNAEFCKICGNKLYNYCIGDENYDAYGNYTYTDYHKNASNARYCETCGQETVFFQNGYLKPWQEYKQEVEANKEQSDEDDFLW